MPDLGAAGLTWGSRHRGDLAAAVGGASPSARSPPCSPWVSRTWSATAVPTVAEENSPDCAGFEAVSADIVAADD